jgi:hypothetical protein
MPRGRPHAVSSRFGPDPASHRDESTGNSERVGSVVTYVGVGVGGVGHEPTTTRGEPMLTPIRSLAAAAVLAVAGVAVGPPLSALAQTDIASDTIISTGPRTVFVPISAYRTYDSRTDSLGKIDSADAGDVGTNQRPVFAGFENQAGPDLFDSVGGDVVAVAYNVQAIQTEGRGFLQVDGFGTADGTASTLVWDTTGQRVANSGVAYMTSAFDFPDALGVYVGGLGGKTHVIIDITGFFVDTAT